MKPNHRQGMAAKKNRREHSHSQRPHTGKVCIVRSGNGYVLDEATGTEFFVPRNAIGTALNGDRVNFVPCTEQEYASSRRSQTYTRRYQQKKKNGPSAKIIGVEERCKRDIVGVLRRISCGLCVVPIDQSYTKPFVVRHVNGGAVIGDNVIARFVSWHDRNKDPIADVIETLGHACDPSNDTILVIRQYGIKDEFPLEVLKEAETVSALSDDISNRMDLRNKFIVTIDPEDARDFDDALSLEVQPNGDRLLGVHIADVSHFVKENSAIDIEAQERGNSVYLCDKVLPMLPQQLSNNICSLKPNEDRLTFSALISFSKTGRVTDTQFARTLIRSKQRLTYEEAMRIIETPDDSPTSTLLKDLNKLAQQLRSNRFAKHALDLDVPECKLIMGPDNTITGIKILKNDFSHQLVEECMVAANEAVAVKLGNAGISTLSRLHESPSREKITDLTADLKSLGYHPGDLNDPANLASFLRSIKDDPLIYHVRVAVLRSMQRAVYSSKKRGHYGLAKEFYTHFTSPIRRYPDLVVHRQLAALLTHGKKHPYQEKRLAAIASKTSETEQTADLAERNLNEIKKLRMLYEQVQNKKCEVYSAVVIKVTSYGAFVEIPDFQIQGFIHISNMSRGSSRSKAKIPRLYKFERNQNTIRAGNKDVYKIGKNVKVMAQNVDLDNRQIDFIPAQ